jgi:hypothetical protein
MAVGTPTLVDPAEGLVTAAGARGAFTAEINPEASSSGVVNLAVPEKRKTCWTPSNA